MSRDEKLVSTRCPALAILEALGRILRALRSAHYDINLVLKLSAVGGPQVAANFCPQLSKLSVTDVFNDVHGNAMHLVVNVLNTSSSNVNPLQHISISSILTLSPFIRPFFQVDLG